MNEYTLITYPSPNGDEIPLRQALYDSDGNKVMEEVGEIHFTRIFELVNSGAKVTGRLAREIEEVKLGKAPDRIN